MIAVSPGVSKVVVVSGNYHVRDPNNNSLINLNSQEGADLVLGLWEYIESLESRDRKKSSRRVRRKVSSRDDNDDSDDTDGSSDIEE